MPKKKLDAEADKEKLIKKPSQEMGERARARKRRQEKAREVAYAKELFEAGVSRIKIAEQIGRSNVTVGKWAKIGNWVDPKQVEAQEIAETSEEEVFEKKLTEEADKMQASAVDEMLDARTEEEKAILELAESQDNPADQYQAYAATLGMQMLRDNAKAIRGPRTIKELSDLDQLIRRNLGLNPRGGTGGSGGQSLKIDINLLNNHRATLPTGEVIDAETVDE